MGENGVEIAGEFGGPRFSAITSERRRRFVLLMARGETNAAAAAREAGYSDHLEAAKVAGSRLLHDPVVLDAIEELSRNCLRTLAPLAISRAKALLENPKHPAHARMIETVLDRTGFFARTEHKVVVEHVDDGRLMEIAARMALELGVDRMRLVGGNAEDGGGKRRRGKAPALIEGALLEGSADPQGEA